jgi:hypothetical protein
MPCVEISAYLPTKQEDTPDLFRSFSPICQTNSRSYWYRLVR